MSHRQSRLSALTRERLPEPSVYTVLSNKRRRRALQTLLRRADAITVRELSEEIAAEEAGEYPAPRKVRESVYVSLHQTHLPTLDEHGVVEYDRDRKVVRQRRRARDVNPYLDVRTGVGPSWVSVYQWLGIVGLFAMVGAVGEFPVFAALPPLVVGSVFLVLIALATSLRLWKSRGELRRLVGW